MYKIKSVKIDGFWHRCNAGCEFNNNVNIIIGKNGTGKTTFMNILHAVLAVDLDAISNNDFDSVEIELIFDGKKRTIKATKIDEGRFPYLRVEYQISQKKYIIRAAPSAERGVPTAYRKRFREEASKVRDALEDIVSLSSLSVYRLRNDDEYEVRDMHGSRVISPVDYRLSEVLKGLMHYQLDLSVKARDIASTLQKDVLASILYNNEDDGTSKFTLDFDKEQEKDDLISAYVQLNAIDKGVRKRINIHVDSIDSAIKYIRYKQEGKPTKETDNVNFLSAIEARKKTKRIIAMSLEAENKNKEIFSQIYLFLTTLKTFISDKDFNFESGYLKISNEQGEIPHARLSSGEKQLLILLTEALLQNQKPHIFLADEPELSLHIEWQRMIVPAVRELNPKAQVIVATHSPEVASKYKDSIIDMEDIING